MLQRPLIPVFFSFAGGILLAHQCLAHVYVKIIPPVFIALILCLPGALFFHSKARLTCLLVFFFLMGVLLDLAGHRASGLLSLAEQRAKVTVEGTLLEPVRVIKGMTRLRVRTCYVFVEGRRIGIREDIRVNVYRNSPRLQPGDKIRFPARLRPFRNFKNPGRFDYESSMSIQGFSCAASLADGRYVVPMGPGNLPLPRKLLEKVRGPVRDLFANALPPKSAAIFSALILGERTGITPELREPFNRTGLGHILAVSGLHIGMVAWVAYFFLRWTLSRSYRLLLGTDIRKLAAFLTCVPVIGYTLMAGFQVSSQRAMIMVLTFLWSLILGKEKEVWSTLSLAGLIILAMDPHALFSISFQLSFMAVTGILWLTPALLDLIGRPQAGSRGRNFLNSLYLYVTGLIAASLAAFIFLLPIVSHYFHRISLVVLPANLTTVPILGFWVIPCGLVAALILPLSQQAAELVLRLGELGIDQIMNLIIYWSDIPWSSFWVPGPSGLEILLFYMLIICIFFFRQKDWARRGVLVVALAIGADAAYWIHRVHFNDDLRVTFLDVGQANSALVEFPGGTRMLIDGGGFPGDRFDVGRMVVAPYLWNSKITKIHILVLSHPQSDHMNGLRFIAEAFDPGEFWYNGDKGEPPSFSELMGIVESRKILKVLPEDLASGREIRGAEVVLLHPPPGRKPLGGVDGGKALNNNSLVLRISYQGKSFLFPGDVEQQGEEDLVANRAADLGSDVLLSPHHGSRSSSSVEFLSRVRPGFCVISSGEGNHFGFPHAETLGRLERTGCRILRIDRSGAVQFRVEKGSFEILTFRENGSF